MERIPRGPKSKPSRPHLVDRAITAEKPKQEDVEELERLKIRPYKRKKAPSEENPTVMCPVCKRTTQADMLLDVSDQSEELTHGERFACDGCWTRWERSELWVE